MWSTVPWATGWFSTRWRATWTSASSQSSSMSSQGSSSSSLSYVLTRINRSLPLWEWLITSILIVKLISGKWTHTKRETRRVRPLTRQCWIFERKTNTTQEKKYKYNFNRWGDSQDNAGGGRRVRESFHWNLRANGFQTFPNNLIQY